MNSASATERLPPATLTTVDVVIFAVLEQRLQVLLVQRSEEPFAGVWSLPGGFIDIAVDTSLDSAARRKLKEKTGIESPYIEQLGGFGGAQRDPRGWAATVVYFALINADGLVLRHGGNTSDARWWPVFDKQVAVELAFDHAEILAVALARLRGKVEYTSLPVHLLPDEFTLPDLQRVFEIVLDRSVDKSAFRKRILDAGFIEPVPGKRRPDGHRPAQIYRVKPGRATIFFTRTFMGPALR